MVPLCAQVALNRGGSRRTCVLDTGHPGDHEDLTGWRWEPPARALERLRTAWGGTHRIAWTGSLWVAVHRDPAAPWRTHVEPTPDQLEERLNQHTAPTPTEPHPRP
ncbi:hypothetical protein SUDANB121_02156 [Nocardiopsis dassonvillei]|uniref:hypothetical protein n=1 Tax=Nocardiopsis dassonvillei TaxID=2014 RepID=UPI003F578155